LGINPAHVFSQLRGEHLLVEPTICDVGSGIPGESKAVVIKIRNESNQPIRLVGGTSSCACIVTDELPRTIGPGETMSVQIRVKFTGSEGRFQQRFAFYTDDARHPLVMSRYTGRVVSAGTIPTANEVGRH
jgi:hypothetical protein